MFSFMQPIALLRLKAPSPHPHPVPIEQKAGCVRYSQSGRFGEQKDLLPLLGIEAWFLGDASRGLVTISCRSMTIRILVLVNSYTSIAVKHKKSQSVNQIAIKKQITSLVVAATEEVAPVFHIQEVQGSSLKAIRQTGRRSFASTFCSIISSFFRTEDCSPTV